MGLTSSYCVKRRWQIWNLHKLFEVKRVCHARTQSDPFSRLKVIGHWRKSKGTFSDSTCQAVTITDVIFNAIGQILHTGTLDNLSAFIISL